MGTWRILRLTGGGILIYDGISWNLFSNIISNAILTLARSSTVSFNLLLSQRAQLLAKLRMQTRTTSSSISAFLDLLCQYNSSKRIPLLNSTLSKNKWKCQTSNDSKNNNVHCSRILSFLLSCSQGISATSFKWMQPFKVFAYLNRFCDILIFLYLRWCH